MNCFFRRFLLLFGILCGSHLARADQATWSVPDLTSNLCGPFSIFACMHWSDAEVRFSGVMKRAGATVAKDGMNVLEVEEVLSSFGFLVKTYYTDWQQISERKQIGIVFIRKPGAKIGHFVAARGRGHDQVEVFDAPKRPSILNISQMPDETIVFIELRLAEK